MIEAMNMAKLAFDHNEVPVGAVIVSDGKIIGRGFNQVLKSNSVSAHAEIIAMNKAGEYLIRVFNSDNQGKYVLATGDIEKFGPLVIAKLPLIMPKVNKFWEIENCPS